MNRQILVAMLMVFCLGLVSCSKEKRMNPLLDTTGLPHFDKIEVKDIDGALETAIKEAQEQIEIVLKSESYGFKDFFLRLSDINERFERIWSPVGHLNSVKNTPELREKYEKWVPQISEFFTRIAQDPRYFAKVEQLKGSQEYQQLGAVEQRMIDESYKSLVLSGAKLSDEDKKKYQSIQSELSRLTTQFGSNVLDATENYKMVLKERGDLAGLPEDVIASARASAQKEGLDKEGDAWVFTLQAPSYVPFLKYSDRRPLREKLYRAYVTRASSGKEDNTPLIVSILKLRGDIAKLMGYENYADYSLQMKMVKSGKEVMSFLDDLYQKSQGQAGREYQELQNFAKETGLKEAFMPWDASYYSEKLREKKYAISEEEVKQYFPEEKVVSGLFQVVNRLYGVTFKEDESVPVWDKEVKYFRVFRAGDEVAGLYMDLYARTGKRSGAWMDDVITRKKRGDGTVQNPVAYLITNFTPPVGDKPVLLTHYEVETLFHEMGHVLHHIMTQESYLDISGISGVPWDGVEMPSQLMENWTWNGDGLSLITEHYKTKEKLPEELLIKMKRAKNFESALAMIRQLLFATIDIKLHAQYHGQTVEELRKYVDDIKKSRSVMPLLPEDRFENSFSHIFSGGYAAGYYGYKWAEVLSADVFSVFEKNGVFDAETAGRFYDKILSRGGERDFMVMFRDFMGREPNVKSLLQSSGIEETQR